MRARLEEQVKRATDRVWQTMDAYGTDMRTAAYIVALERLVKAMKARGI